MSLRGDRRYFDLRQMLDGLREHMNRGIAGKLRARELGWRTIAALDMNLSNTATMNNEQNKQESISTKRSSRKGFSR